MADELEVPLTFIGRGIGLMFRRTLEPGRGMWINPCEGGSIHMLFMRFAIDIVFLNRHGTVMRINRNLQPWRISSIVLGARKALELQAGTAARSQTQVGDQIIFERP